jgi:hypothetical protein
MIFRAVATAAISVVLAGTTFAVVPSATAAPSEQRGCQYPAKFTTATDVDLNRKKVQYGKNIFARVEVYVPGSPRVAPSGSVTVRVDGKSRAGSLNKKGVVRLRLPSLGAGKFTVRANYNPTCRFTASSDTAQLRIWKAKAKVKVNVGNVERGDKPKVRVKVRTATGVTARGDVKVRIWKGGASNAKKVDLRRGNGVAKLAKVKKLGKWKVKASYSGTKNVTADTGRDSFRVTRN